MQSQVAAGLDPQGRRHKFEDAGVRLSRRTPRALQPARSTDRRAIIPSLAASRFASKPASRFPFPLWFPFVFTFHHSWGSSKNLSALNQVAGCGVYSSFFPAGLSRNFTTV